MKKIFNLAIFSIVAQLILGPVQLSPISIASAQDAQTCRENGKVRDPNTGRCVLRQEVVDAKVDANKCAGLSGDAYTQCFKKNAEDSRRGLEADGLKKNDSISDGNFGRHTMPLLAGIISGYFLISKWTQDKFQNCSATSMALIAGGAASGLVTELMAQRTFRSKSKSLVKSYQRKISGTKDASGDVKQDATEAQTYALELMIEQEKARGKAADTRYKGYALSTGLYAAAGAVALYEIIQGTGHCDGSEKESSEESAEGSAEAAEAADSTESAEGSAEAADATNGSSESATPASGSKPTPAPSSKPAPASGAEATPKPNASKSAEINLEYLWLDKNFREQFAEFAYLKTVTVAEFIEMVTRKVWENAGINSAEAADIAGASDAPIVKGASEAPPTVAGASGPVGKTLEEDPLIDFDKIKNSKIGQGIGKSVNWLTKDPKGRLTLSGVMTGYSFTLMSNAKENKKIADSRAKAISKLLADFTGSGGAAFHMCTDKERANPAKPACYCYLKDGSVDPRRVERAVCKAYISDKTLAANDYSGLGQGGYTPTKACFKDGGQVDEGCKVCERSPERCPIVAKAQMGSIGGFGAGLGMNELVGYSNSINTGKLSATDLDGATLERMAARLTQAKEAMAKNDPRAAQAVKDAAKLQSRLARSISNSLRNGLRSDPQLLSSLGSFGNSPAAPIPDELKDNLDITKALNETETQLSSTKRRASTNSDGGFDFDFGDAGGVEIHEALEEVMDKDFAYKGGINQNSHHNIFDILSLRYQRSGLRRLFDEEGKSQADEASDTQINSR